jgi:dTDP-4-amino-4,6-dideoxygalactose transaminase
MGARTTRVAGTGSALPARATSNEELAQSLAARGVQTQVNYPTALPFLPAYARLGHTPADFPQAHAHQSQVLSLPLYPEITPNQVDALMAGIQEFFALARG